MSGRESFLNRVREAVQQGGHAGKAPPLPERGNVGYQGHGGDPVARFGEMLAAAGGRMSHVADRQEAIAVLLAEIDRLENRRILLGAEPILSELGLSAELAKRGCELVLAPDLLQDGTRDRFFAATCAVTGVDYLIAETGTIIMLARPQQPRTASLLPPVHIAIAEKSQILPDLFDLYDRLDPQNMPSCLTHITGPSKTGDIELKLVTGVHGPGDLLVILIE